MNDKTPMSREEQLLKSAAQQVNPSPFFTNELEKKLMNAHKPEKTGFFSVRKIASTAGWAVALAALILTFIWVIRSIAPQPQPAAGDTPAPALTPKPSPTREGKPGGEAYEHFGQTLYLQAELPDTPSEAAVYNYLPSQPATLDSARALAAQLGMNGAVYGGKGNFLLVNGNQRLRVQSQQYFEYLPDYPRYPRWSLLGNSPATFPPNAEEQIRLFLAAHGFQFDYKILPSEMFGGYFASPLTPGGHPICYEHFRCAGLLITLDESGILSVDGDLPNYEALGQYEIISAEEAFYKFLEAGGEPGMLKGMHSPHGVASVWYRAYPAGQKVAFYGWLNSVPSAEGGAPLVTLDGYIVTGNTADIPAEYSRAFVEAVGQLHELDGVKTFALESWKEHDGYADGLLGAIDRRDGQVIITTIDNETFTLPDVPADLPLPLADAFVIGVRQGETFEWKSIDLRNAMGGGGGGGGGLGFYKLNLTGAPVPFPTPESAPQFGGGGGGGSGGQTYLVQEGDTLSKIADQFGVSVEALTLANGLNEAVIFIGQTLVIPTSDSSTPQKVEGLRGMLFITIYKYADGSQRAEYNLFNKDTPYPSLPLEGENLEALQAWQRRLVDVWGTIEMKDGAPTLKMERYEIPFPDLKFQILSGKQQTTTLEGRQVTLFTAADGKTYAQLTSDGLYPDGSTIGQANDEVKIEALIVPGETFGGYPALRIFSASASSSGSPDLTVTADQIYVVDLANAPADYILPTLNIERVELVYYMPDPRYIQGELSPDQRYIQPAWQFTGHYSTGEAFFVLVQALKREFLLPEFAPYTPPG